MGDRRWVVEQAGTRLLEALSALSGERSLVADGRVFVNRRRADLSDLEHVLGVGDEVCVFDARAATRVEILDERWGLLAVLKPAGISTQPDHRGQRSSLLGRLAELTGEHLNALHALHRLDREVSGIVLVARGREGLGVVEAARAVGGFRRRYVAISLARPVPDTGCWQAPIGRGKRPGLRSVAGADAKPCSTRYRVVATHAHRSTEPTLLICEPETGRTHQIRVHAAAARAVLLGDSDYGGARRLTTADGAVTDVKRIALHATLVEIRAPRLGQFRIEAPAPADFLDLWRLVGGHPWDFEATVTAQWLA